MATETELPANVAAAAPGAQPDGWEAMLARHILQSCHGLLGELASIKLNVQGDTARDACGAEWAATEARMAAMRQAPKQARRDSLAHASRQTVGALRSCVQSLAGSPALGAADGHSLRATAMALHAAAAELQQLHAGLRATQQADPAPADPAPAGSAPADPEPSRAGSGSESDAVDGALQAAAALAELLRIFARVSQQSWAATRSQLAHAPSVPSPLASGSALRHRRWVSAEIDAELPAAPGLQISVDGRPLGAGADACGVPAAHSRNRSDSRLLLGGGPLPRKSALSLRQPSQQLGGSPAGAGADLPERSKQVRFLTAAPSDPPVDQAHLAELAQLMSLFEKAIAALQAAAMNVAHDSHMLRAQAIRGLAAAFLQLSRLSSSTGLVRHYDKLTLAQFKATTHAVKLLMPLCPKQIRPQ
ncbi:hypothetical protein GGF44_001226 [Coemansia sp. RSA 1694]|nr:hypothetical protein GGF44_001226 [Coemansia sp. RSA 1694]